MPKDRWRYVVGCIGLAALGILAVIGYRQIDNSINMQEVRYEYQPSIKLSHSIQGQMGDPEVESYDPHCKTPVDREDSDLCAQWSAVKAVERANSLVIIGIWISFWGLVATTIGTSFLVWTLIQSDRSLRLTDRALKQAKESSIAELRPWFIVTAEPTESLIYDKGYIKLSFNVNVKNVGSIAAENIVVEGVIYNYLDHDHTLASRQRLTSHMSAMVSSRDYRSRIAIPTETITIRLDVEHYFTDPIFDPAIIAFIRYEFKGSDRAHESGSCFKLEVKAQSGPGTVPLTLACNGFGISRLQYRALGMGYAT